VAEENQQPLLLAVLIVIGTDRLARRDLVDARTSTLRAELLAEAQPSRAETVRIIGVVGEVGLSDVQETHVDMVPSSAAADLSGSSASASRTLPPLRPSIHHGTSARPLGEIRLGALGVSATIHHRTDLPANGRSAAVPEPSQSPKAECDVRRGLPSKIRTILRAPRVPTTGAPSLGSELADVREP
jgi:hypothetical protein